MNGNEIRRKFLQFFASKKHLVQASYSLISDNDPTLLLIGAGMAPLKPFFTGKIKPPSPRITTCQKCIRTGDIENVGRTARHHTFFEMLGNFSFGDYFKKEAIIWSWEFVTGQLQLSPEKLWVTIHTDDDEAEAIWRDDVGIAAERIIRLKDNFWEIGPGPCGPCSEIYVDLGEERGCGLPDCRVGCDCDRYLEIWNLVFTQYNKDEEGNYTPLAHKNIDTGAGLERIASVLQKKPSNFETDLLYPIIEFMAKLAEVSYGVNQETDVSLKVIADHVRSVTMMISDGILPSNEGRGYVMRRILRRAVRHARLLGVEKMFLADVVDITAAVFSEPYPEIAENKAYIKRVIEQEEKRFHQTLSQGTELLHNEISRLKETGEKLLSGETAFKLYDTFGFPWELTQEILAENNLGLDKAGFDAAMAKQRQRAREARQDNERINIPDLSGILPEKLAHDPCADRARVVVLLREGRIVEEANDGEEVVVVLDVTPFYAEGGGQVGDTGRLLAHTGELKVLTAKKLPNGNIYHLCIVEEGTIRTDETVEIKIHMPTRRDTARNHTATHLLQAALRQVVGEHVNQAGSWVGPDRLRFDFSHFAPVNAEQIVLIEKIVNDKILENVAVGIIETTQDMTREMGATALFGEKYGDKVRVVVVEDFSKELCGGTHIERTGDIGLFKIISETGIGSGLRRIEAVTGNGTRQYVRTLEQNLRQVAELLKTRPEDVPSRLENTLEQTKAVEHELSECKNRLAKFQVDSLLNNKELVNGIEVVTGQAAAADIDDLRLICDLVRDKLKTGLVVLGAQSLDKANFVAMATNSAVEKGIHAGNIIKAVAKAAGGGGGGRKEMAQAGGKEPGKIPEALQLVIKLVQEQVK